MSVENDILDDYSFDTQADIKTVIEDEKYSEVMADINKYIRESKSVDDDESIVDILINYCHENHYSLDVIADVIKKDVYFKNFLKYDCEQNHILKVEKETEDLEAWD